MSHDTYENPLITRYASREMSGIWSAQTKHSTWRRLWIALAEAEQELGLEISDEMLEQLRANVDNIDFDAAARHERRLRHDVMAHVHTYGDLCPAAAGKIHWGATSCYVTDNSELMQLRDSLKLIRSRLVQVIDALARFAVKYRDLPCLGFTHLQPAQPTTVGKRAVLWCYDLTLDLEDVEYRLDNLRFRGAKGTTGTQASFLKLFDGDHERVEQLDRLVTRKMGFELKHPVTGQTYSRKVDAQILQALSGIAQSAHKMGSDLRLLQSRREMEEPFGESQIGSSAMAYKRNPMKAERMCALARFVMSLTANAEQTMATQWLERTLDDSANRRLSLPQACLGVDAILILYRSIADGLIVWPKVIERHLLAELPFIATENIMMEATEAGGDRQELHERIRQHSMEAARRIKESGAENDLLDRLRHDQAFAAVDLSALQDTRQYVGRAPEQVDAFVAEVIQPIRARYAEDLGGDAEEIQV